MALTRRALLSRSLALGCSAAASPLLTPVTLAAAPWENRLVVILLRGGMDGLDVVQPYGDRNFAALRGTPRVGGPEGHADLDGRFALHPALASLLPLWQAGEMGFVHAVSTPYRDKRSHFDGQDLLEAGTATMSRVRDGWLNRLLQVSGVDTPETAFALGHEMPILLRGGAAHTRWSPDVDLEMSAEALQLAELVMSADPAFRTALSDALLLAGSDGDPVVPLAGRGNGQGGGMMGDMAGDMADPSANPGAKAAAGYRALARFAGTQLAGQARIAAFSLTGWDTHRRQDLVLRRPLSRLARTLLTLKATLGPVWDKTAVLAMTEFGRTARLNGTNGTDHGTGGAMLFAGGALRGGQVVTDWPGLAEGDLYASRDLMPTRDLRAHAGWVMRSLFGVSVADLEQHVFPGLELGPAPKLLL